MSKKLESPAPEYDFSDGVRGKYAARYAEGTNIAVLEEDVAQRFPDSKAVNKALRLLIHVQDCLGAGPLQHTKG